MTTRAVFSEHDSEPVRGLPAVLPEGERVLWQGAPNWRSLALNAYHVRTLAYYFGAMVLARGIYLVSTGSSIVDALQGCVGPAAFSLIGLGLLTGVAALAARNLDLAKLVSVSPRADGIEVAVENRQKSSGFTCANPLKPWLVANVCARVPDPAKFDARAIDVDFASIEKAI